MAAAVALIALLLVPHLAAKRTAVTQSREFDRFSPRMRVLRGREGVDDRAEGCHPDGVRLLAETSRRAELESGATMRSQTDQGRRSLAGAGITPGDTARIREIAALRAHRAARLAREQAAGQRRLIASVVAAFSTIVVIALVATSAVGWAWLALPVSALGAALGASRLAAVRAEAAGRAETEELHELRRGTRGARRPGTARPTADALAARSVGEDPGSDDVGVEHDDGTENVAMDVSTPSIEKDPSVDREGVSEAGDTTEAPTAVGLEDTRESGADDSRAWTATFVPVPTYAARERVTGRTVHADTDLRGIPRVAARVPARPIMGEVAPEGSRSTEEVLADQPVAFDLDAVLDNRRAL